MQDLEKIVLEKYNNIMNEFYTPAELDYIKSNNLDKVFNAQGGSDALIEASITKGLDAAGINYKPSTFNIPVCIANIINSINMDLKDFRKQNNLPAQAQTYSNFGKDSD